MPPLGSGVMDAPPEDEAARIERALKTRPVAWREITRRGQTNAAHWLVELSDGERAFVKCARGDDTASWIRDEHLFYAQTRGAPFVPRLLGWDDEGVQAQRWDLVRDGIFVGYQLDRVFAPRLGMTRSNGCSYADSPHHVPIQRMANVSLQPGIDDLSTDDLIARVEDGIYIVGDRSWSIDMQRYNFQFTGQRFFRIRDGKLDGQLRDVAYQSTTTDFWGAMEAVGGPSTWRLGGAFNCGKAQPGQVAPVSHGCPAALFRGINVLNTRAEGGR